MFLSSSARMWLGTAVLAGLVIACSVPGYVQVSNSLPTAKSAVSTQVSAASVKPYAQVVRIQFHWTNPEAVKTVALSNSEASNSQVTQVAAVVAKAPAARPEKSNSKVVQTASASLAAQSRRSRSSELISDLIAHALSLQGVPYQFGGTNRSGFDCSGFTQYVFRAEDIKLPRTAAEQFTDGVSVNRSQLQVGDLVFFTTYKDGASHVGIYIGNGSFVHASSNGVRVTTLSNSYYAARYLGARRVL